MKLFITGGAGFIGSNFIRYILTKHNSYKIVNFDKLTYAGNLQNLVDVEKTFSDQYQFIHGDICDKDKLISIFEEEKFDAIINFAAETHVDRSIIDSDIFIQTNIIGTKVLLDTAMKYDVPKYIQISTDEVYGSLGPDGKFTEDSPLSPNSPYSASKASADMLVNSYYKTYDLPVMITRCSNNYGPYQFPEKLIPLMIMNASEGKPLPIYGDGNNIRDWIYVDDHSSAVQSVLEKGKPGKVYNIGGDCEMENIDVVETILSKMNKSKDLIEYIKDRPGHDKRYAMDYSLMESDLSWEPKIHFEDGIKRTIEWYMINDQWLNNIITKEYLRYYEQNYSQR